MTIIKGSDGSWTWNGGKEGAQRFDELAQAEALAKFDELGELCWLQKNPEINEDTWDEYVAAAKRARHIRTSSTRSCSERWLCSRVVATLLAIVPLLLLEPTRRPLLSPPLLKRNCS